MNKYLNFPLIFQEFYKRNVIYNFVYADICIKTL